MDHHTLSRFTSSRRERGEYTRISLTSPFARTFLSVLFYIFYRSLSFHARSRDFPLASLVLSSLPYPRLFLRLSSRSPFASPSFFRPRVLLLRPSSHLSSPRASPLLTLRAVGFVAPSSSRFSFSPLLSSACLPSSGRTGRSCRARGRLASSWPTG